MARRGNVGIYENRELGSTSYALRARETVVPSVLPVVYIVLTLMPLVPMFHIVSLRTTSDYTRPITYSRYKWDPALPMHTILTQFSVGLMIETCRRDQ